MIYAEYENLLIKKKRYKSNVIYFWVAFAAFLIAFAISTIVLIVSISDVCSSVDCVVGLLNWYSYDGQFRLMFIFAVLTFVGFLAFLILAIIFTIRLKAINQKIKEVEQTEGYRPGQQR